MTDRGNLESSSNQDIYSNIEGRTTIIKITPEGTKVKKGDIICELDSAALRDQLINQRITAQSAQAAYQNAKLAHEVAQLAGQRYKDGVFKHELNTLRGEIAAVRSALQKAESRLERTREARRRLNQVIAGKGGAKTAEDIMTDLEVDDRLKAAEQTLVASELHSSSCRPSKRCSRNIAAR